MNYSLLICTKISSQVLQQSPARNKSNHFLREKDRLIIFSAFSDMDLQLFFNNLFGEVSDEAMLYLIKMQDIRQQILVLTNTFKRVKQIRFFMILLILKFLSINGISKQYQIDIENETYSFFLLYQSRFKLTNFENIFRELYSNKISYMNQQYDHLLSTLYVIIYSILTKYRRHFDG